MFNFMSLQKLNTIHQTQITQVKSNSQGEQTKKNKVNFNSNLHAASIASPLSRKTKQVKKQATQEQISSSPWNNQQFRVFQKIIDTSEESNDASAILELAVKINSINIDSEEKHQNQDNQEQIKAWFKLLSHDERVNVLTTTSPYLVEVLLNMQAQIQKKGPIMFAKQSRNQKKDSNKKSDQLIDIYSEMNQLGGMGLHQHYSQGYSPSFLMGVNSIYQNQIAKFGQQYTPEMIYQSNQAQEENDAVLQQFDKSFYCRVQHQNELKQIRDSQPKRHDALQLLQQNIRFADMYQYLDTITVTYELVENEELLFQALEEVSQGMALQNPCMFVYDEQALMHQVEPPSWFKPERFNCFESWIAAILEQNLWANFHYEQAKSCGQQNNLEYLFDANEMQEGLKRNQQLKLNQLSDVWLNANQQKKTEVLKCLEESQPKQSQLQNRFFKIEHQTCQSINSKELSQLSRNLAKRKKSSDGREFILMLAHSTQERIESGKDLMYRDFLKSIIKLHQEQLIDELLSEPTSSTSSPGKKKKKKAKKTENTSENNPLNQIDLKMIKKTKVSQEIQSIQQNIQLKSNMNDLSLQNCSLRVQQIETNVEILQAEKDSEGSQIIETQEDPSSDDKIQINKQSKKQQKMKAIEESISAVRPSNNADDEEEKERATEEHKQPKNKNKKKKKKGNGDGTNNNNCASSEAATELPVDSTSADHQTTTPQKKKKKKASHEENLVVASPSTSAVIQKDSPTKVHLVTSHKKNVSMANPELLQTFNNNDNLDEMSNQDSVKPSGGRRRNRKKGKGGALDHQEAMNQFIKNLNSKKDENFGGNITRRDELNDQNQFHALSKSAYDHLSGKYGQRQSHTGKNSRIVSRKNSPGASGKHNSQIVADTSSQKFSEKPSKQTSQIIFNESAFSKKNSLAGSQKKKNKLSSDESQTILHQQQSAPAQMQQNMKKQQQPPIVPKGPIYQEKVSATNSNAPTQNQVLAFETTNKLQRVQKKKKADDEKSSLLICSSPIDAKVASQQVVVPNTISTNPPVALQATIATPQKLEKFQSEQLKTEDNLEIKNEPSTISAKEEGKINASSPSFKPSLAAVLGQMEQPSLEKAQHVEKQNSLQQIAQNLEKIKSFQPKSNFGVSDFDDEHQDNEYYQYGFKKSSGVFDKKTKTFVPQYQKPVVANDKPSKINISDQIKGQQGFPAQGVKFTTSTTTTTTAATGMLPIDQIGNLQMGLPQLSGQGIQDIINNATKPSGYDQQNINVSNMSGAQTSNAATKDDSEDQEQQSARSNQNFFQANNQGSTNNNQFYPQINQLNSYNINQFGNLNIGQISNNIPVFQNMGSFQNFGNYSQGPQNLGQNNQFLNMFNQQQVYPQQYFDYNLPQNIEYKFYEKFDNDIYDEVNKIQQQLDVTKEERNYVLNKLQAMCETVFKPSEYDVSLSPQKKQSSQSSSTAGSPQKQNLKPKIQQFGSLVTGLALESSDMDMAVTNLLLPDREKMIDCLDIFAQNLQKWEMIQDLNAISTASIPVIKAIVDLNQLREQEMDKLEKQPEIESSKDFGQTQNDVSNEKPTECKRKKIPKNLAKLKIDITFDDNQNQDESSDFGFVNEFNSTHNNFAGHHIKTNTNFYGTNLVEQKTHLGLASSKLIKNYVENYKCLKEVSIILKQFLAKMELNSPYQGGLSSYSTVLLLVAYMNKWNLKMSATLTPARLLMGFLDYYSYYFNVSLFGIDVSNGGSFYELSSPESNFIILDPLNEQNNTTKNSFLTHEIIKSFRKAFNSLKNLLLQYQQMQNANITDNLVDVILQRNQEKKEGSQQSDDSQRSSSGEQSQQDELNGSGTNEHKQQHIQIQIQQIQQIQILQQMQQ